MLPNLSHTCLINRSCKSGDICSALDVFDVMLQWGLQPNVFTFNALVDGIFKNGMLETADELL